MKSEVYESDEFEPNFIELPLITRPIAGQYFSSKKTSNISGVVAGGDCEFSIASEAGDTEVTISAVNGCYEETVVVDENNNYYFDDDLLDEWEWVERYPGQAEVIKYLNYVTEKFDLKGR